MNISARTIYTVVWMHSLDAGRCGADRSVLCVRGSTPFEYLVTIS